MTGETHETCPRCAAARLRAWDELTDDEREVVRRLPASAVAPLAERAARRRWCARCWHEEARETARDA